MATEDAFTDRLSDYLDGEDLSADERAEIDAHLETCSRAETTLAELRAVAARAASLPDRGSGRSISGQEWPRASRRRRRSCRLRGRGTAVSHSRCRSSSPPASRSWCSRAASSGSCGSATLARACHPPSRRLDAPGARRLNSTWRLRSRVLRRRLPTPTTIRPSPTSKRCSRPAASRLDAETVRILEDNLRAIDQAIEQSRKALRSDPNSVYLNNHFAASRNRKLALLRRASALAMAQDSFGGS